MADTAQTIIDLNQRLLNSIVQADWNAPIVVGGEGARFFLEDGRDWYGQLHAGYASADEGLAEGFVGAARSGRFSAMLAFTHRDAEGQKTPGTNDAENADRTKANPEDNVSDALLAKIVFAPNEDHRFRFTIDALRQDMHATVERSTTVR